MFSSRTFGIFVPAVLAVVFLASAFARSAGATTIYTEEFPSTANGVGVASAGWFAYAGSACTDISSSTEGAAVIYNSVINGGAQGHAATWPGYSEASGQVLVGTSEFSAIDRSQYSALSFSWYQCVSDTTLAAKLAVRIGDTWYASGDTFTNTATYTQDTSLGYCVVTSGVDPKSLALSSSNWRQMTVTPDTALSVGTTSVSLPTTGNIVAAGLYTTGSSGVLCFDSFTISGQAVPEPNTIMLLSTGLIGLLAYAWRKRR